MIKIPRLSIAHVAPVILLALCAVALAFVFKGDTFGDTFEFQSGYDTRVGSPFESSNSTSRYVLTEAIVKRHTFSLTEDQAKVSSPDLVKYNGIYMTIFTPGVSFLGIPFYILGSAYGVPQIATYTLNIFVAIVNVYLIARVARKLGASNSSSYLGGLVYLFATNALVYTLSFTQHQLTVLFLLAAVLLALQKRSLLNSLLIGMVYAGSILIDIPNAFILLPELMVVIAGFIEWENVKTSFKLHLHFIGIAVIIGMIPMIGLFAYYNHSLTGSYSKIGQFIGGYNYPDSNASVQAKLQEESTAEPEEKEPRRKPLPLQTRLQRQGIEILLFSKQRSWLYYSPIVLLGITGLILAGRNSSTRTGAFILVSSVVLDISVYASFGDPWGGWAFGPRYLIPAAALLCACLGVLVSWATKQKPWFFLPFTAVFFVLVALSVKPSVLGALTTAAIPPRGAAEALKNDTPWTTEYNYRILNKGKVASLAYNAYLKDSITPLEYWNVLIGAYILLIGSVYMVTVFTDGTFSKRSSV